MEAISHRERAGTSHGERIIPTLAAIDELERHLLPLVQRECPITNYFAPGVYIRECLMPAGAFVIGHKHRTEHMNVVLEGRARVLVDGVVTEIQAGMMFKSEVGVRKMFYVIEDLRFATVHPTSETDLVRLEEILVDKSPAWQEYHGELKQLTEGL